MREALGGYVLSPQDPLTAPDPDAPSPAALALSLPASASASPPPSAPSSARHGGHRPAWFSLISQPRPPASPPASPHALPLSASSPSPARAAPPSAPAPTPPLAASPPPPPRQQSWADALSTLSAEPAPPPAAPPALSTSSGARGASLPSALMAALVTDDPFRVFPNPTRVGVGGVAEVYKCVSAGGTGAVAVKAYTPRVPGGAAAQVEQIANELDVLMHCRHANLVRYSGAYLWRERVYAVVEYCERGTLQALYKESTLPEPAIAFVLGEVLQALAYLHSNNRLHRDVKAENVLLTAAGEVKLADYGALRPLSCTHTPHDDPASACQP